MMRKNETEGNRMPPTGRQLRALHTVTPVLKHEPRQRPTTEAWAAVMPQAPTARRNPQPPLTPGAVCQAVGRLPGRMLRMTWHTPPPTRLPVKAPHPGGPG